MLLAAFKTKLATVLLGHTDATTPPDEWVSCVCGDQFPDLDSYATHLATKMGPLMEVMRESIRADIYKEVMEYWGAGRARTSDSRKTYTRQQVNLWAYHRRQLAERRRDDLLTVPSEDAHA